MRFPTVIKLQDNEIEFKFTMAAWERLEDEVCSLDELEEKLQGKGRLRLITKVASILSVQPLGPDALFDMMRPADVRRVTAAIMQAITDGLKMEEKQGESDVHDVVLEEIDAKKEKAV